MEFGREVEFDVLSYVDNLKFGNYNFKVPERVKNESGLP